MLNQKHLDIKVGISDSKALKASNDTWKFMKGLYRKLKKEHQGHSCRGIKLDNFQARRQRQGISKGLR